MKHKITSLYFILLLMKEITSAPSSTSLLQYDITKAFDRWFSEVLNFDTCSTLRQFTSAFREAEKYPLQDFEYDLDYEVEPFGKKIFFHDVVYKLQPYIFREPLFSASVIDWNLRTNAVSVSYGHKDEFPEVYIKSLHFTKSKFNVSFVNTFYTFRNFKLHANASSNSNSSMDISYDFLNFLCLNLFVSNGTEPPKEMEFKPKYALIEKLKPAFIAMLKKFINHNSIHFDSAFKSIFNISNRIKQEIISTNADIFQKGRKYYYLIPNIPFCCGFTLKTVVIKGLSNIESLKFFGRSDPFSHSVLMKNVHGTMVLDYKRVEEKPLTLYFKIPRLSMSIVHANDCVIVEAPEFCVNSTATSQPITPLQSTVLMQTIQSAIVSSLMPSKQICNKSSKAEVPVAMKLKITEASDDWNRIKEICKDWIPLNKGNKRATLSKGNEKKRNKIEC